MPRPPALPPALRAVIEPWPKPAQRVFRALRRVLFETAQGIAGVGPVTETLKWGEPAYLTEASRSGSTVRLAWQAREPASFGVYFNCQTTLVDDFRTRYPELPFVGNRALLLPLDTPLPEEALADCFGAALTYHWRKRKTERARAGERPVRRAARGSD